tara:strand:- start:19950 stop:20948 length:999 start_codon:yes stop_codon:yes gene_type:complete
MNQRTLKLRIGLFLVAAFALFVGSLFYFGLADVFEKRSKFVSFFNESVRGLNKGSLVRFRGVEIGQVIDIRLSLGESETEIGIPVIYEIDISRIQNKLGVPVDISEPDNYQHAIRDGLTAKLENSSMVTGQLYIDLDFRPKEGEATDPKIINGSLHFIPSTPSVISDVTDQSLKIIDDISKIQFEELSQNLNTMIVNINKSLEAFEALNTAENVNGTLLAAKEFIDSGSLQNMTEHIGNAADSMGVFMNDLNTGKGSLGQPLASTLSEMAETAKTLNGITDSFVNILNSNTGPVADFEQTLADIQDATLAFQSLLDFLRRHPNALIFGKQSQ